jgi:hypothetical protein
MWILCVKAKVLIFLALCGLLIMIRYLSFFTSTLAPSASASSGMDYEYAIYLV